MTNLLVDYLDSHDKSLKAPFPNVNKPLSLATATGSFLSNPIPRYCKTWRVADVPMTQETKFM